MKSKTDYTALNEKIQHYLSGSLSQEEIDELWVEAIKDPEVMEYLKTSVNLHGIAAEEEETQVEDKPAIYRIGTWSGYVAAAVVIIGLLAGSFIWYQQQQAIPATPEAVDRIELDIMRSAIDELPADRQNLQSALSYAVQDNEETAFTILDSLRTDADLDEVRIEATLTKGILLYNSGDYEGAAALFETNIAFDQLSDSQRERSRWYLSQCYLRMEKFDDAYELAGKVIELDGSYYRAARQLLDQFD